MHKLSKLFNVDKIVTIHYQALIKHYSAKEERHDFWELIYADKENITVVLNGEETLLSPGEVVFIKPNQKHFVTSGEKEPNIFIISFSCHSEKMRFFENKSVFVPPALRYLLQNMMAEAIETFYIPDFDPDLNELKLREKENTGGEQIIKNSLELLMLYLLRSSEQKQPTQEFLLSKIDHSEDLQDEIVKFLSSKIYGKFDLDELCAAMHYGKTRLCTLFRKKTGSSIYQTYLKMKTDEAKKLIRKKTPFAEIADKLYFDSAAHFNSVFKKYAGMTPGEYKASIK